MASLEILLAFQRLEQHLCRVRHRVDEFRSSKWFHPTVGHNGMVGLILSRARAFLRQAGLKGVPNNTEFAALLDVDLNNITALLRGEPTGTRPWARVVEDLMPQMFARVIETNRTQGASDRDEEITAIRDRIQDFLFRRERGADRRDTDPSFLHFRRRAHGVPCSFRELVQEVGWFARQPGVGWFKTDVTLVTGTVPFPPFDPVDERIVPALRRAKECRVSVRFILPADSASPPCADEFEVRHLVPEEKSGPGISDPPRLAVPRRHMLFLRSCPPQDETFASQETELALYYLHDYSHQHPYREHTPVVSGATPAEEGRFGTWLDQFLASPRPAPADTRPGKGRKRTSRRP
jgi:hypothetical protein